jgi:excisionase family DNA binding protein
MASTAGPRHPASLDRAASHAGVSTRTIRRRIADGSITGYRFGPRVIRVDLDEVESLFKRMPAADRRGR